MKELYAVLPDYVINHLDLFRNKVHGIKGVSRQLGKENIALLAEIMEMAAITENRRFIEAYFDIFYKDLEYIIASSEKELNHLNMINSKPEVTKKEISAEEVKNYFEKLTLALKDYEISETEDILYILSGIKLDEKVEGFYNSIRTDFEEMEYESAIDSAQKLLANW